jgi:hypothetical protein
MNIDNIPEPMKRVMQDKSLTIAQKMMTFMAFMPNLPEDPRAVDAYNENLEVGKKIKHLVDEGKIRLGKFDNNFNLEITNQKHHEVRQ